MRASALCDRHAKLFEEPEDPMNRSFFSEIISSISDVKLSNNGRYMISRDYLSVKVWDLHMESKPIETYPVSIRKECRQYLVICAISKCRRGRSKSIYVYQFVYIVLTSFDSCPHDKAYSITHIMYEALFLVCQEHLFALFVLSSYDFYV